MSDLQIKISISNLVVLSTRENLQLYIDATVQARKCDRKNKDPARTKRESDRR